jgi:outer membrane protein OmpA-like peptidoglycan-associated protein
MKRGLTLTGIAMLALVITGCGNKLAQPMPGPTPTSTAENPGAAQSTLNVGGQASGPLVPGNYPPRPAQTQQAAPAAAAPAPAREFTVYFAFNKATLTSDGRSVIQQAAAAAKEGSITRITVTGHTDTVGSANYNQRLSERRANAVRKALIAEGVPANEIDASGVGKSELAVPTADGVKEPRNRRAVIMEGGPGA